MWWLPSEKVYKQREGVFLPEWVLKKKDFMLFLCALEHKAHLWGTSMSSFSGFTGSLGHVSCGTNSNKSSPEIVA